MFFNRYVVIIFISFFLIFQIYSFPKSDKFENSLESHENNLNFFTKIAKKIINIYVRNVFEPSIRVLEFRQVLDVLRKYQDIRNEQQV